MTLQSVNDLFKLAQGAIITKRNLFDLIQYSKQKDSDFWSGEENKIGNTPQQGINWIGTFPTLRAVIIKTKLGSYSHDGWTNEKKDSYRYSFKSQKGNISFSEKANSVLLNQQQYLYPILLFIEEKSNWVFEGFFKVENVEEKYVVLNKRVSGITNEIVDFEDLLFEEGDRRYVTHLMAERNKDIVKLIKSNKDWICDICNIKFSEIYGVEYIEAHHKKPISTYASAKKVKVADFSLLCPNCHKAVHIYLKKEKLTYTEVQTLLKQKIQSNNYK